MTTAVETAVYLMQVKGKEDLDALNASLKQTEVLEEKVKKSTRTTTEGLQNRLARLDPIIKAQEQYRKGLEAQARYEQEQTGTSTQRAAHLQLVTQRYHEQIAAIERVAAAQQKLNQTQQGINQRLSVADPDSAMRAARATDIAAYGKSLDDLRAKYNPVFAAGRQYKNTLAEINMASKVGAISESEHAAAISSTKAAFVEQVNVLKGRVAPAATEAAKAIGLNRYELLNLSRQLQDVGVSLAGGQSPFVVLTQQGSQILDVFQATNGSVRGFFSQAIGWAGRFVASTAGVVTGLTGIGAAALYMGASFASAQKDIDKALSGIGAASGVDRGGINRIAGAASSPTGLSVSEAREAATAFAATGKIQQDNILRATLLTKDFARAMGVDASEATKQLAKDLSGDLVGAALKWNATLGFADGKTIDYIQSLVSMGQRQEAINALITAAVPAIGRMAEHTSKWGLAWDFVANKASNAADAIGRAVARGAQRVTGGVDFGGFSDQDKLDEARSQKERFAATVSDPRSGKESVAIAARLYREASEEVTKFEQRLAAVAKQSEQVRFAQMSIEARDFARSVNEGTAQIERLSQGLAIIEQLQARRISGGGSVDPGLEQAAQIARVQLALALEQEQVEQRKAQVISQNALKYQDTSTIIANQRELMAAQLVAAQAITGQQEIAAQHELTLVTLKQQGLSLSDRTAIADGQRAISIAQANAEAGRMLINLQQQGQLLQAASDFDRDRIAAAQTYKNLLDKNVDSEKARAVAMQQLSNADFSRRAREEAEAQRDAADAVQRKAQAAQVAAAASERAAAAAAEAARRWDQAAESLKFLPFYLLDAMGKMDQLFDLGNGKKSQFDPKGYVSDKTASALGVEQSRFLYGEGGFTTGEHDPLAIGVPNAQGLEVVVDRMLGGGGSISDAIDKLLTPTLGRTRGGPSDAVLQTVDRLINLLPDFTPYAAPNGVMVNNQQDAMDRYNGVGKYANINPQNFPDAYLPGGVAKLDAAAGYQKADVIQKVLSQMRELPQTVKTLETINRLESSLKSLTDATKQNTSATAAMTDVLSPFYSSDPRRTHLGFRPFAGGGIMSPWGEIPINQYAGGGIATSPQVSVFGEGSTPEAYVPVPSGRIPVEMKMPANSNTQQQRPIQVSIVVQGNADKSTVDALKRTAYQQAQAMRRVIG